MTYEYLLQGEVDNGIDLPYIEEHTIYADNDNEAVRKAGLLILNSETLTFNDSRLYLGTHEIDVITGKRYSRSNP